MKLLEDIIISESVYEIIPSGTQIFVENLEKKRKYLEKKLKDQDNPDQIIDWIAQTDPVAVKSRNRKTPFVNQILDWYLDGKIRLPEDIETTRETLQKYNEAKQHGQTKPIDEYNSPGNLSKDLDLYSDKKEGYDANATLIDQDDEFKLYRIDDWDQGSICFADSGWCVQHENMFNEYNPPYYMVTKDNKRYVLMHKESNQIKDIHNVTLSLEQAKPIKDFILKIWPVEDYKFENDLMVLIDLYPKEILETIMKDPASAYEYAAEVIRSRWPEAEPYIMKSDYAVEYATEVIRSRWPEAEPYIMKSDYAVEYAKEIIKGRWPEAEPYIMKSNYAVDYAINVIEDRWPEAEPYIMKDPLSTYIYATEVIKGRWPEAEPYIMKNSHYAFIYAKDIIKGRWPEAEPYIMKSDYAVAYAKEIIKGRWPEAEPYIHKTRQK